ncbi:MAG: type III pantothenate kinase [Dehalococcoidales bacterium]|nr:type III pantothenate kinase [Dehalococcoidales bacterium]
MLLAVDIGNTNIKLGIFDGDKLRATLHLATHTDHMPDEYAVVIFNLLRHYGIEISHIKAGAISCVVPPLLTIFGELFERYFGIQPLAIGPGVKTGVRIRFENTREVGGDRISNTAGALSLYKPPIIAVAMGTATVFDTISRDKEYLGGAVAPGIAIAAEALYSRTAALPRVELLRPKKAIGTNTVAAMQSGIIFGYAGLIDGIVTRIQEELGEKATVVATGGYSGIIAKEAKTIDKVNPNLTLVGIKVIYDANRAQPGGD